MVKAREDQLNGITILDRDGSGTVTTSGAALVDVGGETQIPQASSPGNNSFWVQSGSPSLPKFTNSTGTTITIGSQGIINLSNAEYWIDRDAGSDITGNGTQLLPWASLDAVFKVTGDHIANNVKVNVAGSATPYSLDSMYFERMIEGNFWINGTGHDEVQAERVIDSHVSSVIDLTTAAPGWTAETLHGLHVELIKADNTIVGYYKILDNTANTLTVSIAKGVYLVPGDKVRIVRPAVKFQKSTNPTRDDQNIVGANSGPSWGRFVNSVIWYNVELISSPGVVSTYKFAKSHAFYLFIVSCNFSTGNTLRFTKESSIYSGLFGTSNTFFASEPSAMYLGCGLSMINPANLIRQGAVNFEGGVFYGTIVCANINSLYGAVVGLVSARLTFGTTSCAFAGYMSFLALYQGDVFVIGYVGSTATSFYYDSMCEGSLSVNNDWTIKSSGEFLHVRSAFVFIGGGATTPTFSGGGSGANITALFGGQVRLSNGTYLTPNLWTWLGTVTAGLGPGARIRPPGGWDSYEYTETVVADAISAAADLAALKVVLAQYAQHDGSVVGRSS